MFTLQTGTRQPGAFCIKLVPFAKVMVGGAPITQSYADQIGADAYTPDASTAAEVAKSFVA